MMRPIWLFALAGGVAACTGQEAGDAEQPGATPETTATATAEPSSDRSPSRPLGSGARAVAEETDDFLFEYSYPAEAGLIPELATLLDLWLAQRREELAKDSADARREARSNGFPYNKHSYTAEWKVVAELPRWLSLSADVATYTGGAHGNYWVQGLIWDKEEEDAFDAKQFFTSPAALYEAVEERFCDSLDQERSKRREIPVEEFPDDPFAECPGIDELEVLVGSSNRRTFNRLTLYAGPYVAGPYAEGAYEVNVNMDAAVLATIKPQFREAFSARN